MHMMNDPHQQQQFCLRWNNHSSTLVAVFDSLLSNESLVDVTLFAEGKLLRAHKVVLSACSPYFQTLFAQTIDKHPIVILKDVKHDHLKALLDYMYRGEVNISQDQLGPLIKTAESLKIKGLADGSKEDGEVRSSLPYPLPSRPSKPIEPPSQISSPATSLDIKPRLPPVCYASASNAAPSVLSTALTMPPALSLAAPLNLPHLPNLPPSLASSLASSLSTSIPHSMPSSFPQHHDHHSRHSDSSDSPHAKKRKKHRRHSGEGMESPDSDCPSSGSPGDSVSNFHLPRIPATITPISHQQHHHLSQPQQHPKDLSSHSHNNHHDNSSSQPVPALTPAGAPPLPPVPPVAHIAQSLPPQLLPTSQHSHSKPQEYPEDLKHHPAVHPPPESQQNSHHHHQAHNPHTKPPLTSRDNHDDRNQSPSPPFERNCTSRGSRRDEDQRPDPPKGSPTSKLGSDPETVSPTKGPLQHGKTEDTSSDNNHYSDDEGDETSNERCNERASDYSLGPSTSRPHSEEAAINQNYLSWSMYPQESSNTEESMGNLADNPNQDYLRAINLVRAGFPGFLPTSMHPELLSRPTPIGLPLMLKGNRDTKADRKGILNYPYPEAPKTFNCEKCGRSYASTGNLKRHKKYECGVEPQFSCPICKKKFQHRHSVKIHVYTTHRNEGVEGGQNEPARDASAIFSTADSVATVATGPLRDEYFPIPQEASSSSQNQDA